VYVCNFGGDHSAKADVLMRLLIERFAPERAVQKRMARGEA
jgi:S-adenosylmethionine decarboxylase